MTSSSSIKPIVYSYGGPLAEALFFERTNRFECKVQRGEHGATDVYCPNTGSMLTLVPTGDVPQRKCLLSTSTSSSRKHSHTLEAVQEHGAWVNIHSRLANDMVHSALQQGLIPELQGHSELNREVTSQPSANNKKDGVSRTDFELVWRLQEGGSNDGSNDDNNNSNPFDTFAFGDNSNAAAAATATATATTASSGKKTQTQKKKAAARITSDAGVTCRMLVEVKSVTLSLDSASAASGTRNAQFPDCVSTRASKHLRSLMDHIESDRARRRRGRSSSGSGDGDSDIITAATPTAGADNAPTTERRDRAAVLFVIQRDDIASFSPCHLDAAYTAQLEEAVAAGVEVLCYSVALEPATGHVTWGRRVEYVPNPLPDTAAAAAGTAGGGAGSAGKKKKMMKKRAALKLMPSRKRKMDKEEEEEG
jgi:DNA-binding sugar fermentation-stimulating protein